MIPDIHVRAGGVTAWVGLDFRHAVVIVEPGAVLQALECRFTKCNLKRFERLGDDSSFDRCNFDGCILPPSWILT